MMTIKLSKQVHEFIVDILDNHQGDLIADYDPNHPKVQTMSAVIEQFDPLDENGESALKDQ